MGGRHSRNKGARFERWVANVLKEHGFPDARRGWQQRQGDEMADVEGTPWWVECKAMQRVGYRAALRQAEEATDGRPVVVIAKDDREDPVAVMRLKDWLHLVEK